MVSEVEATYPTFWSKRIRNSATMCGDAWFAPLAMSISASASWSSGDVGGEEGVVMVVESVCGCDGAARARRG
jgi:hypothetical protein